MRASIRGVGGHDRLPLTDFEFCAVPPGSIDGPRALAAAAPAWRSSRVPNTAAGSLRDLGEWSLSSPPRRFDADDWWYRCRFREPAHAPRLVLGLDGLATVADVWLNGELILTSDNQFRAHELELPALLPENELLIRFRSLDQLLKARRPRPRWRAPMVENQQLRWFRTTLLGRTPGWSPPAQAVGPWRDVWIDRRHGFDIRDVSVRAALDGDDGVVELDAALESLDCQVTAARLIATLRRIPPSDREQRVTAPVSLDGGRARATLRVAGAERWWPHTHGAPATYSLTLEVDLLYRGQRRQVEVDFSPVGFRHIEVCQRDGGFAVVVNGVEVFCRGACWTPPDVVTLRADGELVDLLGGVRRAGMNMLRVGGTMVYESREFLELCDQHGILVWQDLMFANLDYPDDDAAFIATVRAELTQQLGRLLPHPCVAVICGNSEVEQQAAMWGATRERWQPRLFHEVVPALLAELRTAAAYWPSSAHGGAFPHQVNQGTTSYYGVGAYLRPLEDARRAEPRFATECLGFANVPEDRALAAMPQGLALRVHHPDWKLRVPRDLGAGWDFDDVRDFYLKMLFDVDPVQLRYADHDRYLRLSRIVSGEVMAAAFNEWRRARSSCRGALVWFLRDLWPGAGWGLVDALGEPKAAFHALARVLQPVAILVNDEGNNGLALEVVNDTPRPLGGTLEITLYRAGEVVVAQGRRSVEIAAHGALELPAMALLEGFYDLTQAYRFGPPSYDVAVVTLRDGATRLAEASWFPGGRAVPAASDIGLGAALEPADAGWQLVVRTRAFARWVTVEIDGYSCRDQYFHLAPGGERRLTLYPRDPVPPAPRGRVLALNAAAPVNVSLPA